MHLFKETDLTLEKAIKVCQASKSAKAQIKTFCNDNETAEVVQCANTKKKRAQAETREQGLQEVWQQTRTKTVSSIWEGLQKMWGKESPC